MQGEKKKATGKQNIKKVNKQREISCYCRRQIHPVAPDRDATDTRKEGKEKKKRYWGSDLHSFSSWCPWSLGVKEMAEGTGR